MTCIIGFNDKENKKLYMMGDSLGVGGLDVVQRDDPKVFRNGEFVLGYTSSFRMGQIIRFADFPQQKINQDDYEYMCTDFVDYIIELFESKKYSKNDSGKHSGGNFLVGYRGTLYNIENDFQVGIPSDQYDSVGCGFKYALASIDSLLEYDLDPLHMMTRALEITTKRSAGVRPPFVHEIMDYGKDRDLIPSVE